MIPFVEVNALDRNAEYLGVPTSKLMENAGKGCAKTALDRFDIKKRKVVIICGPGNNGGDGFVCARHLAKKCDVRVVLVKPHSIIRSDISKANFKKIKKTVKIKDIEDLDSEIQDAALIIDSMLGIGISGEVREPYLSCIRKVNESSISVLSMDVPSGLGGENAVKPEVTVTFHDFKEGMTQENSGEIVVIDIGIPEEAGKYLGPGEFVYYPKPKSDSHKGDNGRLLIVGGGPYTGAPALAGLAAYRIGADLVHIATPKKTYETISSFSPNFIVHRLGWDVVTQVDLKQIRELLLKVDAVIVGPGLGDHPDTQKAVLEFVSRCKRPIVIDADAIGPVAKIIQGLGMGKDVITPHAGEFKILSGESVRPEIEDRAEQVRRFAKETGFTILLKGEVDVVSDGEIVKLNRTGNPAMTVGGTGDVLAGLVGGMMAKGVSPFNSARIGAFTNGYAGDLAFEELGYSMMATDIIAKVPEAMKYCLR